MYLLISIIGILFTILFVVGTHESAHFFMARLLGIKVLRFSIGFGKTLWRRYDKSGTEYIFALIPLGGYVQMLDEKEGNVPEAERHLAFNTQPFYKKFLVVSAGPLANILCALLLYWIIFMIGFTTIKPIIGTVTPRSIAAESGLKSQQEITHVDGYQTLTWTSVLSRILMHVGNQDNLLMQVKNPCDPKDRSCPETTQIQRLDLSNWTLDGLTPDPLKSLGIIPYQPEIPLVIGVIQKNSPASISTLKIGDKMTAINQKKIATWEEVIQLIRNHPNETISLTVLRDKQELTFPIKIGSEREFFTKKGYLGIAPQYEWPKEMQQEIKYPPLTALTHAGQTMVDLSYFNLILFGKLLIGKLSLQSLGGPIMIFQNAGDALNYGFLAFISFLAFLSVSIGIINCLPIPGLDGGHLFFQIIELIIRRPIPDNILLFFYRLGFFLIIFMLIQAIINDLLRLY